MSNHDVVVRPYRAADLHALSSIWFEASASAHSFLGQERLREHQRLVETQYLPAAETWVASVGDAPVGFISLLGDFVGGLFVAPSHHGRGIGRTLLSHAIRLKGGLELEVYTANTQAMAFYRAMGFTEISRRESDDEGLPFENARLVIRRSTGS